MKGYLLVSSQQLAIASIRISGTFVRWNALECA
jgi:hypothetical protein